MNNQPLTNMKPLVLITLIISGLFFSSLYAETSYDTACNDSKNIAPFSESYSYYFCCDCDAI